MLQLTQDVARSWLDSWDRQQEGYLPDREERFTAMIDAIELGVEREDPLVIDLGCGPGSLSTRLLERLPKATVIGLDTDPLLLALGRAAYGDIAALSFVETDIAEAGWSRNLGLDRPADAAVSTTALHWLLPEQLRVLYAETAGVLTPGGLLLNGDNLRETAPTLRSLEGKLVDRKKGRRFGVDSPPQWDQWWDDVLSDPVLSQFTSRKATSGHHTSGSGDLATHVEALIEAGFAEVGTVWQSGHNRVVCAVR